MSGSLALEQAWVRFALSGTLIAGYGLAEWLFRRRHPQPARLPAPRWVHPLLAVSLGAYYLLIGPTGGPLLSGLGNLGGVVLIGLGIWLRQGRRIRYPSLAGRTLLYVGLPLAVGVPWGLLVLGLPAIASSVHCCVRAERREASGPAAMPAEVPFVRHRLVPGLW